MLKIYAADWVLPITSAPIDRGAMVVENERIVAVGKRDEIFDKYPSAAAEDFGNAALLPGFVNAHAHLELTALRNYLDEVENEFSSWLLRVASSRDRLMTFEDIEVSAVCGAIEAARAGVTCIADIGKHAGASVRALREIQLRGFSFQENPFALDENAAREIFAEWKDKILALRQYETGLLRVGVTPHAPYTVSRRLFELVTDFALKEKLPVTIHAAESRAEDDFMRRGAGNIAETISRLGVGWNAPQVSTIRYLHQTGVLETSPLLAHCVLVDEEDMEIIAQTDSRVAHCPKSNAKFAHGIAPFAEFLKKDLRAGLGSDSVASNNRCDILEEARFAALFQRARGIFVSAEDALRAATIGGARAVGLENEIGSLEAGKQADFTIISFDSLHQQPVFDPVAALVFASTAREVVLTVVAGRSIYENGKVTATDEADWRQRLETVAKKLAI